MSTVSAFSPLDASLIESRRALLVADHDSLPGSLAPDREPPAAASGLAADLGFFATCYLAGLIFFLIMLS